MKFIAFALSLALSCLAADEWAPQIKTVLPRSAKPGDTVVITGVSLGEDRVDEVYLSDHKFDMKVKVLEQTGTTIKFRVPPFAKGRMQLLMLIKAYKDEDPKLLELPAYLLVDDATEMTQVQPSGKTKKSNRQDQQK
jgi:hypothetical protein